MSSGLSFKLMGILCIVVVLLGLVGIEGTYALEQKKGDKTMDTEILGGVPIPTAEKLAAMQEGQYILHARDGKLTKVAVEKSRVPYVSPVQGVALAPDGTVYVMQQNLICESKDGGRTWTSYELGSGPAGENLTGPFEVLSDGTFVCAPGVYGGKRTDPVAMWASSDKGRSWEQISQIELPAEYFERYIMGLSRLADDTLLWRIQGRNAKYQDDDFTKLLSGKNTLLLYRSLDKGRSWRGPSIMCDWASEGGIVRTAPGKLLATIRHQRPPLPDDPPDLLAKTGASRFGDNYPYKHVFLADSEDEGLTWKNFRQLTTVFGQCYGFPVALSDGTVVVSHDHRYPGGLPARTMISYDEGETWEDEVYYLFEEGGGSDFSRSVVLEDDVILTIVGATAIRWQPVRD